MNYAFLPDLFALAMLVGILLMVRRKHSEERTNAWLLGLGITLVESVAHTFYARDGIPNRMLHVVVVDCYLLSGLVFVWASSARTQSRPSRLLVLALNGLPLLALATPYGLNLRVPHVYVPAIIGGIVLGVVGALAIRKSWQMALLLLLGWSTVAVLVERGFYRDAVYWALAVVYLVAAINFQNHLKARSTGKVAIVAGFGIWAAFFLFHPWLVGHASITDLASHMWNLQKSLISLGMILVMLEEQASSNEYLAHHDELTGLANRRMFANRLQLAIDHAERRSGSLAVLMLDLDGFKGINDTLGHLAGDTVLQDVAHSLRSNVRGTDMVARMGGDEFIILAEGLTGEAATRRFAESIRAAVEHPLHFHGQTLHISASVGMALYPDDARDAIRLLRVADQRMYSRKQRPVSIAAGDSGLMALPPAQAG